MRLIDAVTLLIGVYLVILLFVLAFENVWMSWFL